MLGPISQDVPCCNCSIVGGLEIIGAQVVSGMGEKPRKIKFAYKCKQCYAKCFQVFSEDQLPPSEKLFLG
jgi:hypothetical protein